MGPVVVLRYAPVAARERPETLTLTRDSLTGSAT